MTADPSTEAKPARNWVKQGLIGGVLAFVGSVLFSLLLWKLTR
jgi:hypothetical protein